MFNYLINIYNKELKKHYFNLNQKNLAQKKLHKSKPNLKNNPLNLFSPLKIYKIYGNESLSICSRFNEITTFKKISRLLYDSIKKNTFLQIRRSLYV